MLAIAWLMPNHQLPWTTFHSDLTTAVSLSLFSLALLPIFKKKEISVTELHVLLFVLIILSVLYKLMGVTRYWTQVILPAIYILGFLLAVCVGQVVREKADSVYKAFIFIPPLIAAVVSVGLQLSQWLSIPEYGLTDIWISESSGIRPSANMNQPNQLATLLLWACISTLYFYQQRLLGLKVATLLLGFLCFGVGLTLSRTGLLNFLLLSIWLFYVHRNEMLLKHVMAWLLTLLVLVASWTLHLLLPEWLGLSNVATYAVTELNRDNGLRLTIWQMFVEAVLEKPLWGHGPLMNLAAQYSQLSNFPQLGGVLYTNAHNLALELAVWFGVPVATVVVFVWGRWLFSLRRVFLQKNDDQRFLIAIFLLMLVHASLELPLHHAYFLLPAGLIIGGLISKNAVIFSRYKMMLPVEGLFLLILLTLGCVGLLTKEYLDIERQVTILRFKEANIANTSTPIVPQLFVLDQLAAELRFHVTRTDAKLSDEELLALRNYLESYPYCDAVDKFRLILVSNQKMEQADMLRVSLSQKCPSH
ncbi:O-antigen ligase-related [Comamonadaceae bacterium]